jgi:crotonobetainyl-CoA:carnitine CoA-transferase CaiB-like acyl-CoA transferase
LREPAQRVVTPSANDPSPQFSQMTTEMFNPFLKELGLGWMLEDPEWSMVPRFEDAEQRTYCWEQMLLCARQKTLAEWLAIMDGNPNIWAEQFRSGRELLDHPQVVHNKQVVEIFDPELGPIRQPDRNISFKESTALTHAPRRGEHDTELRTRAAQGGAAASGPQTQRGPVRPPLEGLTVLEFGVFFAGPYGATNLADLGARVIKIEPLQGDPMRMIFPVPETSGMKVLQGKESVALTLSSDEGRAIVHELARRCDAVLQSFRPGVACRLGVDAATLRAINPDLVYLNAPGYGVDGPCGERPAFGMTMGAATVGLRHLGPTVDARPDLSMDELKRQSMRLWCATSVGIANCDGMSGLVVASSLLTGILAHQRGVPGPEMLTTMIGNMAYMLSDDAFDYADRPSGPQVDDQLLGCGALYRLYETADGWIFLAAPQQKEWAPLVDALAADLDLAADPRFTSAADRAANDTALAQVLAAMFKKQPAAEWERRLTPADVGCVVAHPGPAEDVLMSDEFGRACGLVTDVVHPIYGEVPRPAPLVRFSRSTTTPQGGCTIGQHTRAVLAEIGFGEAQIQDLVERNIVGV